MSRFVIASTPLAGLRVIGRRAVADHRGSFSRLFCHEELAAAGWSQPIAQINHSVTAHRGTIRGLHFQHPPHGEMKLVSCIRGMVWDVAVDIRAGSPTFLQWHAELLSAENGRAMLIPEGIAHGFQTMTEEAELVYCHSAPYVSHAEAGLCPFDSMIAVPWPLPATEISDRDANFEKINPAFQGVLV